MTTSQFKNYNLSTESRYLQHLELTKGYYKEYITQYESIYKTEADSQTWKTNLWLPKGKGGSRDKSGIWGKHTNTTIYNIDKQQGPTI